MRTLLLCETKSFLARQRVVGASDRDSEHLSPDVVQDIVRALEANGCSVSTLCLHELFAELREGRKLEHELCVNLSVGGGGPSTKVYAASLLDLLGIPYLGSPPHALAITRDKAVSKAVAQAAGVPTPAWVRLEAGQTLTPQAPVDFPAIVKPVHESCSIGITPASIVRTPAEANARAAYIWRVYGQAALVETFVPGIDIEVPLIGHPLIPIGIAGVVSSVAGEPSGVLTSAMVYRDAYRFIEPVTNTGAWPDELAARALRWSSIMAEATGIRDYGRADFRLTPDGELWFIELSTHPYLAQHSSFAWCSAKEGRSYVDLWARLLMIALTRDDSAKRARSSTTACASSPVATSGLIGFGGQLI